MSSSAQHEATRWPGGRHVGVLFHPKVPASRVLAGALAERLTAEGAEPIVLDAWAGTELDDTLSQVDWVVVLGGDGTMLRTARRLAPLSIPIIGVNFGRLGFLTEIEAEDALTEIPRVLAGEARIERRLMLRCGARVGGVDQEPSDAVNEVFVGRGQMSRPVRLDTLIDGAPFTRYFADGLVLATPTGSTAYSLSAGGPVIGSEMEAIVLTPVVPHPIPVNAMVLPGGAKVTVIVHTDGDAILAADGITRHQLRDGDVVEVGASPHRALFLRLGAASTFYGSLVEKLRRGKTWQSEA